MVPIHTRIKQFDDLYFSENISESVAGVPGGEGFPRSLILPFPQNAGERSLCTPKPRTHGRGSRYGSSPALLRPGSQMALGSHG